MSLLKWALLLIFGFIFFMILYGLATMLGDLSAHNFPKTLLYMLGGLGILGFYALWTRIFEKTWPSELSLKNAPRDLGIGFGVGVGLFCALTAILAIVGFYDVHHVSHSYGKIISALAMFFVVAVAEEVLFRGLLFRMIDERFGTWLALVISAILFGFVHIMNANATLWSSIAIAIEAGIMLALAYKYSENLWMPIGIHWAWNFTQGNIFGFAVSGGQAGESLLVPIVTGPDIITGGGFGPEASINAAALGILISLVFVRLIYKAE